MPHVRIDAVDLYFEIEGEGPPLLLLAGLASDSQSWAPVRPVLAQRFRLILPDNRGCGRTTPQDAPISLARMADDAAALLDHVGVARAHVLGHSMGGLIAATFAARHAQRVDRLVLAGACAQANARTRTLMQDLARLRAEPIPRELFFRMMYPWLFAPPFFADPNAVSEAARLSSDYPYPQSDAAYAAQAAAAGGFDAAALAAIAAPTLILCGALDLLFSPDESEASFVAIADRRTDVLPGAAHSLHWDQPAAFSAAVAAHLSGL
jgi:pimeloyl-ACP methyl ester carboxylesterase